MSICSSQSSLAISTSCFWIRFTSDLNWLVRTDISIKHPSLQKSNALVEASYRVTAPRPIEGLRGFLLIEIRNKKASQAISVWRGGLIKLSAGIPNISWSFQIMARVRLRLPLRIS